MLGILKNLFKKEKETLYFAEFRINGTYRKIQLPKEPNSSTIKANIFILKIESFREIETKDNIEIIYQCTYVTTKY